jgi:hypothetical protein
MLAMSGSTITSPEPEVTMVLCCISVERTIGAKSILHRRTVKKRVVIWIPLDIIGVKPKASLIYALKAMQIFVRQPVRGYNRA